MTWSMKLLRSMKCTYSPISQKLYVPATFYIYSYEQIILINFNLSTDMCKAFLQEKKWSQNKETPTFKDYIENGWVSSSGRLLLSYTYFLISKTITSEGLEPLENYHNLIRWPSTIFRLANDLATSTVHIHIINHFFFFYNKNTRDTK